MPGIVPCPSCDKKLKPPEGAEGKKIRCPGCKTLLLITEDGLELAEGAVVASKPAAKPVKKRPVDDDDEDEKPVKKKRRDEDEDEDEKPAKSKKLAAVDDDEDEPADDDEDEDRPRKKKKKGGPSFFAKLPKWAWYAGGGGIAAILLLIILFVFVLGGGSGKLDKIKEGMTEKEVTDILGKPTNGDAKMLGVVWYYHPPIDPKDNKDIKKMSDFKAVLKVYYKNDKVTKVQKFTKSELEKNPMGLMP